MATDSSQPDHIDFMRRMADGLDVSECLNSVDRWWAGYEDPRDIPAWLMVLQRLATEIRSCRPTKAGNDD